MALINSVILAFNVSMGLSTLGWTDDFVLSPVVSSVLLVTNVSLVGEVVNLPILVAIFSSLLVMAAKDATASENGLSPPDILCITVTSCFTTNSVIIF